MSTHIVFDGPPSHQSGRFVEVENDAGQSINAGEWKERPDKLWELVIDESTETSKLHAENERLKVDMALRDAEIVALHQANEHLRIELGKLQTKPAEPAGGGK